MPEPSSTRGHRAGQTGFTLLGAGVTLALAVTLGHARQEVFYIPAYGVVIAAGAFVLAAIGLALSWRSRRYGVVTLTMLAVALGMLGVLAIFSIGVLLLAGSLVLFFVVAAKLPGGPNRTQAAAGGVLLGLGLPALALMSLSPPLVDCQSGSSGENIFLGFESDSAAASASLSADGRTETGRAQGDTYEYAYRCRDGKLARFDLRRR